MPKFINPKHWYQSLLNKLGDTYLKSYIGMENNFYKRNHVVAFDIDEVKVNLREKWLPHSDVQKHIDQGVKIKPPLYDGLSLKLWAFAFERIPGTLELDVSFGRYSDYLFTNLDKDLREKFPNPKWWFNPLNIGALVMTSDNKVWFYERPVDAKQSPGKIDTPCGHPTGMEEVDHESIALRALYVIVEKEMGFTPKVLNVKPLVAFWAHPDSDFNLMYLMRIQETSAEVQDRVSEAKHGKGRSIFVDSDTNSLTNFLRNHKKLSRSAPEAILHLIRMQRLAAKSKNK